uniref:Large ribosomal subunit protein bL32c n=1 Tax=Akkesiphycus lubricus TaxID=3022 RepID=A0A8F0JWU1_AKKLU|nr:ribosomal protein L32 [Akkesiphycus lubricus]
MAVPKKRRSKAKGRTRLSNWKAKGRVVADKALNLAKSIVNDRSKFLFDPKKKKVEDVSLDQAKETDSSIRTEKNDDDKTEVE